MPIFRSKKDRRRRRKKRRAAIGGFFQKAAPTLATVAATSVAGPVAGGVVNRLARSGGNRSRSQRKAQVKALFQPDQMRSSLALNQSVIDPRANSGLTGKDIADMIQRSGEFTSWLRRRGEFSAIPFIIEFVASGGTSLPGQVLALWGQFVADTARMGGGINIAGLNGGIPPGTGGPGVITNGSGNPGTTKGINYGSCKVDPFNAPLTTAPVYKMIQKAPPGYVLVTNPTTGETEAMLKGQAQKCGLWKPRPKPPITAAEYKTLRTAVRVEKKAKKLAIMSGYKVTNR